MFTMKMLKGSTSNENLEINNCCDGCFTNPLSKKKFDFELRIIMGKMP